MFRELFAGNDMLDLAVVSMLLFFAVFVGVVVWVYAKKRKPHYDRMAQMPLDDEYEDRN